MYSIAIPLDLSVVEGLEPCVAIGEALLSTVSYTNLLFYMFAVLETGGKQYIVKEGETLNIEKIEGEVGAKVTFDTVLLVADENGTVMDVGAPYVSDKVTASIVAQDKAAKIRIVKFKAKVRYTRRAGHRQPFTAIKIEKIG